MSRHTIPVLKKAIAVLDAVSQGNRSTKALSQSLKVPPSTTYRILQTFLEDNWIRPTSGGQFALSFGLLPLLHPLMRHESLIETIREPLEKLSFETGLSVKLSIRQGSRAIAIFRIESTRAASFVSSKVGAAIHLVQGATGIVLLSALSEAERRAAIEDAPEECWHYQSIADVHRRLRDLARDGISLVAGKANPELVTMAAPLNGADGPVGVAVALLGFSREFDKARVPLIRKQLLLATSVCRRLMQGKELPVLTERNR